MELGELDAGNEGFRNLSRFRLLLSMSGVSLSLVFFLVVMTLKGKFSFLWFVVTLVCGAGTILTAMGWRSKSTWIAFAGAASLLSFVIAGIAASR